MVRDTEMRLSGMTMTDCCPWNRTLKDKFMASPSREGFAPVSEVHSLQDGVPHGYEWWLDADQRGVYHELHRCEGKYHGIERRWNHRRKLHRGYPKYWVRG